MAKTMRSRAMLLTSRTVSTRGTESPMNTSAPLMASAILPWRFWGFVAPAVEGPVLVDADDVPGAEGEQHLDHRRARGAHPRDHDLELPDLFPHDLERVEQRPRHHHGGPVLIVVEDGDVELLAEPLLHL